jgi:hypothetical protein
MISRADWTIIDQCLSVPTDPEQCRRAIANPKADWLAVCATANHDFVGTALWTSLSRAGLSPALPADVRNYLELLHTRNAERNQRIRAQCIAIGAALASAGLRCVVLKGATWLFDGSEAPAADRMMRDIDLLLPADDVEAAVKILVAAGYQDSGDAFVKDGHLHFEQQEHFHHAPLLPRDGEALVEIHWDLAYRTDPLPTPEVIAAGTQVAPGLLLPAMRHRILHNVVHAQILNGDWAAGRFDLRDGLDLARLVEACGPQFDWARLADDAKRRGSFAVLSGAIHTAHRILRSPLPPPFADDRAGRLHAWRCANQRHSPLLTATAARLGFLLRAFAWDREAYALDLGDNRSLHARFRVNIRRVQRAYAAVGRLLKRS